MSKLDYNIDDLFSADIPESVDLPEMADTPSSVNQFTDGVSGGAIVDGEIGGILKSVNFDNDSSAGWQLTPTGSSIILPSGGFIRSGQTAYHTGTGFYLGNDGGTPKFSIGDPSGKYLTWDGSDLTVNGYVANSKGVFGGDGADGALSISSGTTNIDLGSASVVIKNYTSISITGTAAITFTNPHANGTIVIFKSQGNVTITTSATRAIDLRSLGGTGGTGGTGGGTATAGADGSYGNGTPTVSGGGQGGQVGRPGVGGVKGSSLGATALIFLKSITIGCGAGGGGGGGTSGASTYYRGGGGAGGSSISAQGTAGNDATGDPGTVNAAGGDGGRGGGAFYLECKGAYSCSGTIDVAGANGSNGAGGDAGGGGGGAGGVIAVLYNTLTSDTGTYTVSAGTGGTGVGGGGNGGAGAAGVSLRQINSQFA